MKRTINVHIVLALGLGLTLALLGFLGNVTPSPITRAADLPRPAGSPGDVYCVTQDGGSYIGCTQVFTNVQAAVDAASGGETIKVATGVYTDINTYGGLRQIVYISKTVIVQGGYTTTNWTTSYPITQPTTLDARGQGRVLYISGNISPTIEGLGITGGKAYRLGGHILPYGSSGYTFDAGGGVYIITATTTLSNNHVFSNVAEIGNGLFLRSGNSMLSHNTISDNHTDSVYYYFGLGGGLFLYQITATLRGNNIISNTVRDDGGGLQIESSNVTLIGNLISGNKAVGGFATTGGLLILYSRASFDSDIIVSNTAESRGALFLATSDATMTNTVIRDNETHYPDGGLCVSGSSARLIHTTIAHNIGGDGIGVYLTDGGSVAMTNSILSEPHSWYHCHERQHSHTQRRPLVRQWGKHRRSRNHHRRSRNHGRPSLCAGWLSPHCWFSRD